LNLLGLDTSTAASAACVVRSDGEAFEAGRDPAALGRPPAHGRELLPAVADALERAGLSFGDLQGVAVGVGPGAFTGLRIGVSTARSIASALGLGVRPVSSLAVLASGIPEPQRLALIDARRGEVFGLLADGERAVLGPAALAPAELVERVRDTGLDPLAAGEGAVRFRDVLEAGGVRVAAAGSGCHLLSARAVCRLAESVEPIPPEAVTPDYRRLPDAQER
jgi:tRNA threonylcarbamoyladenosine biosynthesis protein TsaB